MKQRRAIGRLGGYAEEVAAAMRRRTEKRKPRVRIRIGHGEARVLPADSQDALRLQALCQSIVDSEGARPNG